MARSRFRGEQRARGAAWHSRQPAYLYTLEEDKHTDADQLRLQGRSRPRWPAQAGQDAQLFSGEAVKVLYLYCHPLPESFHAGIRVEALAGLKRAGHQVDLLDLYAEGFDPVLSEEGRRHYHDESSNRRGLEPLV